MRVWCVCVLLLLLLQCENKKATQMVMKARQIPHLFFFPLARTYPFFSFTHIMLTALAWTFIACIIVFFLVIVFLLFFTRAPNQLSLSLVDSESNFEEWLQESEEQIATLSEDARLSYERAKGKESLTSREPLCACVRIHINIVLQCFNSDIHLIVYPPISPRLSLFLSKRKVFRPLSLNGNQMQTAL